LNSGLDDRLIDVEIKNIENRVLQYGGKCEEWEKWGRRGLSYEIKGRRDGYYAFLRLRAPSKMLLELDRILKLNESVLRHMIVKIDERKKQVLHLQDDKNISKNEEVEEYG